MTQMPLKLKPAIPKHENVSNSCHNNQISQFGCNSFFGTGQNSLQPHILNHYQNISKPNQTKIIEWQLSYYSSVRPIDTKIINLPFPYLAYQSITKNQATQQTEANRENHCRVVTRSLCSLNIVFHTVIIFFGLYSFRIWRQYNFFTISMSNWLQPPITPQSHYFGVSRLPSVPPIPFAQFTIAPGFLSQLINRIASLQQSKELIFRELTQLRSKYSMSSAMTFCAASSADIKKGMEKTHIISKIFPKHMKCPVSDCRRSYSSKIALRSHLRKSHLQQSTNDGK